MINRELCDNYLTYLKDKGFSIDIINDKKGTDFITIYKGKSLMGREIFTIKDIEDDLLPFIDLLSSLDLLLENKVGVVRLRHDEFDSSNIDIEEVDIIELSNDELDLTILSIYVKESKSNEADKSRLKQEVLDRAEDLRYAAKNGDITIEEMVEEFKNIENSIK